MSKTSTERQKNKIIKVSGKSKPEKKQFLFQNFAWSWTSVWQTLAPILEKIMRNIFEWKKSALSMANQKLKNIKLC
jgi:hypothetical protein